MSDALEKLKNLGAQRIYEDVYIPIRYVQDILDERYEGFSRMQFFGFISIIEKNYNIDLQEIKSHAIEYYDTQVTTQPLANAGIFVTPLKQKNFTIFYIVVALFIFLVALYYTFNITDKVNSTATATVLMQTKQSKTNASIVDEANSTNTSVAQIKPALKQTVKKVITPQIKKISTVLPEVKTPEREQNLTKKVDTLEILPRSRVWLGYINMLTNKKYQKTFSNELDLNASKEWLFIFGHGYIDMIVNGVKRHFNDRHTLRLHYKDGNLTKISIGEFKKLNRGRKW